MMRCFQPLLLLVGFVLLASIVMYIFRVPMLVSMARFLSVPDRLMPADIIYLLGGDYLTRAPHAAALFKQKLAANIAIPKEEISQAVQFGLQRHSTNIAVDMLVQLGVDASAITVLENQTGGVTSTHDEAMLLKDYVSRQSLNTVIIVTTAFHTRRSRWIFKRVLKDEGVNILMSPAEHIKFNEGNWWKVEKGFLLYIEEYIKFIYYLFILDK